MRILICANGYNDYGNSRVNVFALDQAKALRDYGHDVRLVSIDLRSIRKKRNWHQNRYELEGIKCFTVNYFCGNISPLLLRWIGSKGARRVFDMACDDGWNPDILHAHFTVIGYCFADIAKQFNVPFVITEHSSALNKEEISKKTKKIATYAYLNADTLIAVSNALACSINRHLGIESIVVPNVLDIQSFSLESAPLLSKDKTTFVTAANLIEQKGIDLLIDAFSKLKDNYAILYIFGDGPMKRKLEEQIEQLGFTERVYFMGHCSRSELFQMYSIADCFVLPSLSETFGVAYIEAMATGLPVIATCCGGPEDFIIPSVGKLIPKGDVEGLTQAMEQICEDTETYDREKIKDFAFSHFGPETIATSLTQVYKEILKRRI